MNDQFRSTKLPGAPVWFQPSLPGAPAWFQPSAERIEFETATSQPRNDDFSADEPEFDEPDPAQAAGVIPPDVKTKVEFEPQSSAATASAAPGMRIRDVMLGGAATTVLFAVFSVGFLSRGLMMPSRDSNLRPPSGATAEIPAQRQSETPPAPIPAESGPAAPTAVASVSAPKPPQPKVDDRVETEAAAPDQPMAAAPQLKLPDSLTHSIMAKPTLGSLKMAAAQPVSLNLASSAIAAQTTTNGQTAQCSGPPQGPVEGTLGTKIAWADTPDESWQLARDQKKLVFMMHVSGNFEKPGFT
jgi:hypothetical protein